MTALAKQYRFFKIVEKDLASIETLLMDEMQGYDPVLADAATHLMKAGGKRLRPIMAILAGRATSAEPLKLTMKPHYLLAIALELLHTATLIHDDIIDRATVRRGLPTVNEQWGERTSVLTGDFLLARSCYSISLIEKTRLNQIFSQMVMDMCNGEISQFTKRFKLEKTRADYYFQIERKTALLMAVGCQGAGIINQIQPEAEQALYAYGRGVGMAFQVMDDILDFTASSQTLGKPNLHDISEGHITLPLIYALAESPQRQELQELVVKEVHSDAEMSRICQLVTTSGGLDYAREQAQNFVIEAQNQLKSLPPSPFLEALHELSRYILERNH